MALMVLLLVYFFFVALTRSFAWFM